MKKIGAILFIGLFIVGGYTGYRYYADTYKGEKAYAQVPLEIPERKQTVGQSKKHRWPIFFTLSTNFC